MAKDYYDILGVSRSSSADEIKKAYRKLSRDLHPDRHKGDKEKEQKFKEVNEAYEVLGDPKKKQSYDQFGSADGNPFGGGGAGFGGFNAGDFNGQFTGDLGDIFESFFGGGRRGAGRQQKGADIRVGIVIDFMDAVTGAGRDISFETLIECETCKGKGTEHGSKLITCTHCGGTGQVTKTTQSFFGAIRQTTVCPDCNGSGKVPEKKCKDCGGTGRRQGRKTVTVNIPKGIHNGQQLRMRGDGQAGVQGEGTGDLYIDIDVRPDPRFLREGDDIHSSLLISISEATLGAKKSVETVHGPITLKIPAGTQPKEVLRVKGKGMPVLSSSKYGDHYVTIDVEIPTKLSRNAKKLLEELNTEGM